ncbi:MAG: YeeE/YedE family protein [Sedimentisphaerales bacterium]|nr:YeeE/YedE family protein [Sedimentisphaerales bacterium]
MELLLGTITGVIFGFLLQKGQVLRFEKQVGFLLLRDMTIIKFMFSAILVGVVGIHFLNDLGTIDLEIKDAVIGAQVIGGLIFGIGWAIAGYCPGTSVGAFGEGRLHALWAILGMIAGAALYAEAYPTMKKTVLTWGDLGKITIPDVVHLNQWIVILVLVVVILAMFNWFRANNI